MTLTLQLPPELEARARADATARRVPLEDLAMQALEAFVNSTSERSREADETARLAAIDAGYGMSRGRGPSVDEFLAQRHAEGEAEYHRWHQSQSEAENEDAQDKS